MQNRIIEIDALKAAAVTAVIIIHSISAAIAPFLTKWPQIGLLLGTDQIMRFSVPFFITVSGYLLAGKYQHTKIEFVPFLKKRALQLLPMYFLWSGIIYLYLNYFTGEPGNQYNLLQITFLGRADYHLYFVPVLFYLYLTFPILIYLNRKSKTAVLITALTLQLAAILFANLVNNHFFQPPFLWGDQQQYVFPLSWIFYFVLGIYLQGINGTNLQKIVRAISVISIVPAAIYLFVDSLTIYKETQSYISATTFTRLSILIFASLTAIIFLSWQQTVLRIPKLAVRLLSSIGKRSYNIYLFHTLVIRILYQLVKPENLLSTAVFILGTVFITFTTSAVFYGLFAKVRPLFLKRRSLLP